MEGTGPYLSELLHILALREGGDCAAQQCTDTEEGSCIRGLLLLALLGGTGRLFQTYADDIPSGTEGSSLCNSRLNSHILSRKIITATADAPHADGTWRA